MSHRFTPLRGYWWLLAAVPVLAGFAGYSTGSNTALNDLKSRERSLERFSTRAPAAPVRLKLVPQTKARSDGQLLIDVALGGESNGNGDAVIAISVLDDAGEEWIPEEIHRLPAGSLREALTTIAIPTLPNGYYRLKVVGGRRLDGDASLTSVTSSVFFALQNNHAAFMSHSQWLEDSSALTPSLTPTQQL